MLNSIKNKLSQVRQLKCEDRFTEALKIINKIEKEKHINIYDQFEIHHLKSSLLFELGYMNKALTYIELAYNECQKFNNKFQLIDVLFDKIAILNKTDKRDEALKIINLTEDLINTINQTSSDEFKEKKGSILLHKAGYLFNMGNLNQSLSYVNKVLKIAKDIENKKLLMHTTKLLLFNNSLKGNLDRNLEYIERYLALAEELNDKQEIIGALNSYGIFFMEQGDFDRSLGYLEQSLSLCNEIHSFKTVVVLSSLFELYLHMGALEKAQKCLNHMKHVGSQVDFEAGTNFYTIAKAIILKRSPQKVNQLKAKEILKHLIEKIHPFSDLNYNALIELCDLNLSELRETNNLKLIDEIQPYFTQLKNIAKNEQSYWLLVEVLSLQAKLKLITFEFKESQKLLKQAIDISEKHGLKRLNKRIAEEQDELSKNYIKWEKMKLSGVNISERINLTHLDEQIKNLLWKRKYLKGTIKQDQPSIKSFK